ncbi:hypothetical protein AN963_21155 [Brevibacillus choshinensis]|uniref:Uncharacterized protein n=1 Tax=Brevibacillus choshinensis TaxID=54911 RepID=A0ABR5N108_BRECH|nr:hypothetical protein [Brevibacillus choshinensis]KQL43963.1 hypothetical protein AN963_21155 [Brevibacillus choshinensis]
MQFIQVNKDWGAEPNAPQPRIIVDRQHSKLVLRFFLYPFIYDDVKEGTLAELGFQNCYLYSLGSVNDEEFYRGLCWFSTTGIKW